jgi:tripartite-type tricarboxylate transporter receptor subunit TctC
MWGFSFFFLLSLLVFPGSGVAQKADYPQKPIKWIVMWQAGGGGDTASRIYTKYLEKILGQKIVVENITGGGGSIGYAAAKRAKPDGYTLVVIQGDLPKYKPMNLAPLDIGDFDILGSFCYQSPVLVTQDKAPWKTAKDFVADAKKNPDKMTIGVSDIGGIHHQPLLLWMDQAGFRIKAIAHDGSPAMNAAILGGHVNAVSSYIRPAIPYVKEKQLRFIGYFGAERIADFPDVPTFKEMGYDIVWEIPYGIGAPKGLPENVKKILADANKKVWEIPEFRQELEKLGQSVYKKDPAEYLQHLNKMQKGITKALDLMKR